MTLGLFDPAFLGGLAAPSPGAWTPSDISTALWLDATDAGSITEVSGAISEWRDKSGNDRHATQYVPADRPTYSISAVNGENAVTFDGVTGFMSVAHASALDAQISPSTISVIYKKSSGFRVLQKKNGYGVEVDSYFFDDLSSFSVAGAFTTSYSSNQNAWTIDVGAWDGSTIKHWRNGAKLTATDVSNGTLVSGEIDPSNEPSAGTSPLYIGKRDNPGFSSGIMTGQIVAIVICESVLSEADRQKLEGYYAHLLGLTTNLPTGHPYKSVAP